MEVKKSKTQSIAETALICILAFVTLALFIITIVVSNPHISIPLFIKIYAYLQPIGDIEQVNMSSREAMERHFVYLNWYYNYFVLPLFVFLEYVITAPGMIFGAIYNMIYK